MVTLTSLQDEGEASQVMDNSAIVPDVP